MEKRRLITLTEPAVREPIEILIKISPDEEAPRRPSRPTLIPGRPFAPTVDPDQRCRYHGFAHSPYYDCTKVTSRW